MSEFPRTLNLHPHKYHFDILPPVQHDIPVWKYTSKKACLLLSIFTTERTNSETDFNDFVKKICAVVFLHMETIQ